MTTERQRDAETDRLLRLMLQPGVHHDACPDANMLAAFAEGALAAPERDDLEIHFAECHRCQEALASMARAWPAPDAALPSASARWRFFRPRWLVPLAAAAILVMYVAVRPVIAPYFPPTTVGPAPEVAQTPAPVPTQVMADARPSSPELTPPPPPARAMADTGRPAPKSIASVADAKGAGQPAARSAETAMLPVAKPAADIAAPVGGIAAPTAMASPDRAVAMAKDVRREALPASPPAAGAAALPRTAISESVVVSPPPTVTTQAASVGGGEAARQQLAMKANESIALPEVVSPDGAVAWVIGPGGRLSRSTDRRVSWQPQVSGVSVELLAGSAPSAVVCWMVGTAGTVIVTTDGTRWSRVAFPERVDLVAVEATDGRVATVTTRDGRRFATRDAGATWSLK